MFPSFILAKEIKLKKAGEKQASPHTLFILRDLSPEKRGSFFLIEGDILPNQVMRGGDDAYDFCIQSESIEHLGQFTLVDHQIVPEGNNGGLSNKVVQAINKIIPQDQVELLYFFNGEQIIAANNKETMRLKGVSKSGDELKPKPLSKEEKKECYKQTEENVRDYYRQLDKQSLSQRLKQLQADNEKQLESTEEN